MSSGVEFNQELNICFNETDSKVAGYNFTLAIELASSSTEYRYKLISYNTRNFIPSFNLLQFENITYTLFRRCPTN